MQKNRSKRYRAAAEQVDRNKAYSFAEAVSALKKLPATKFDQTVTMSFRLGVDPKQSDQMVRGTCPLPHGSGKTVRVLVFAEGEAARAAKNAGAEYVGFMDLVKKCQEGFQDFDVAVATPADGWRGADCWVPCAKVAPEYSNRAAMSNLFGDMRLSS